MLNSFFFANGAPYSLAGLATGAGPLTGMKYVEMRVRRRNYVIDFSNFQVKISINVQFHKSTV